VTRGRPSHFYNERLLFAKSCFSLRTSFPLQEQPLRTKLKICTETDYLRAHLTVIEGESRGRTPALYNLKPRVTSVLKKWLCAISASQRFWAGSDLAERGPWFMPADAANVVKELALTRAGQH
jgi:hypothetical protein